MYIYTKYIYIYIHTKSTQHIQHIYGIYKIYTIDTMYTKYIQIYKIYETYTKYTKYQQKQTTHNKAKIRTRYSKTRTPEWAAKVGPNFRAVSSQIRLLGEDRRL